MNTLLLWSIVVNFQSLYFCLFTVHGHLKMATCLRASAVDFASLSSDDDLEIELIE